MTVRMLNKLVRETLDELLDDPGRFRHWLKRQPLDLHFESGDSCGCPLRVYLNDCLTRRGHRFEFLRVMTDRVEYQVAGAKTEQEEWLPDWACRFSALDQQMGAQGICLINRTKALAMLEECQGGD